MGRKFKSEIRKKTQKISHQKFTAISSSRYISALISVSVEIISGNEISRG